MNKATLLTGAFCLVLGTGLGHFLTIERRGTEASGEGTKRAPLFYQNPMNPAVTSPVPTTDSMGMDYIPVYAQDDGDTQEGSISINPVVQNNIGVRTTVAEIRSISRSIRAVGRVDYAEDSVVKLHPKVEGWIRHLRVDKTGQPVVDGEILLDIYSPKLVASQQEYLLALNNEKSLQHSPFKDIRQGASALVKSSRARLTLLDVAEQQVTELQKTQAVQDNLHILAPTTGIVTHIGARQGQFVTPATELYQIVDLRTVWIYADIYEYELPWVKEGDPVEMTLRSLPGKVLRGHVAYIYPYAKSTTRTTQVRLVFDNAELILHPETLVDVTIHSQESVALVVPTEAIVRSGDYNQIYVMKQAGTFEPRKVTLGIESGGDVAVLAGVEAGERVVVSAQFLIDSESKLHEASRKMLDMDAAPTESDEERSE
jgi:Cu(I)/Ag(I) efflux system membrane fusion protein